MPTLRAGELAKWADEAGPRGPGRPNEMGTGMSANQLCNAIILMNIKTGIIDHVTSVKATLRLLCIKI